MHNEFEKGITQGMQVMNDNGGKATRVHIECCSIASMFMVLALMLHYNMINL